VLETVFIGRNSTSPVHIIQVVTDLRAAKTSAESWILGISGANMSIWVVRYSKTFDDWFAELGDKEQDMITSRIRFIKQSGPTAGRPYVDRVHQSRHQNMKELRGNQGLRVLFAFDTRRDAILLVGGNKSGRDDTSPNWNSWYDRFVPIADHLFDEHSLKIELEGLE